MEAQKATEAAREKEKIRAASKSHFAFTSEQLVPNIVSKHYRCSEKEEVSISTSPSTPG